MRRILISVMFPAQIAAWFLPVSASARTLRVDVKKAVPFTIPADDETWTGSPRP